MGCQERGAAFDASKWDDLEDWGFDDDSSQGQEEEEIPEVREPRPDCDLNKDNLELFGLFRGRNLTSLSQREVGTGTWVIVYYKSKVQCVSFDSPITRLLSWNEKATDVYKVLKASVAFLLLFPDIDD